MLLISLEISVKVTHCLTSQDYFHATYSAGSLSEIDSLVDDSLTLMMPKDCFHATYYGESISGSSPLATNESLSLIPPPE